MFLSAVPLFGIPNNGTRQNGTNGAGGESRNRCLDSPPDCMAGWPLNTCLHAKVQRFGTQACGNDNGDEDRIFEMACR